MGRHVLHVGVNGLNPEPFSGWPPESKMYEFSMITKKKIHFSEYIPTKHILPHWKFASGFHPTIKIGNQYASEVPIFLKFSI